MLQLLRKIAFPFSMIYAMIVHIRNILFDIGFFKSKTYRTPSICIGNLSVGGTGKTPMIEYFVRHLSQHKVAVLSRGYKRKSKGFLIAGSTSTVEDLGDEPYQLHQKFPELIVAVDTDRRNGIEQLESRIAPDLILLDDAFQHRRVKPSYVILLTTYTNLYSEDWYLPTGNLRDAKRAAKRANIIMVTKCPNPISELEKAAVIHQLKPKSYQKVLFSHLEYAAQFKAENGQEINPMQLKEGKIALVTGIAFPEPLVSHLQGLGIRFKHLEFADHHNFTAGEIKRLKGFDTVLTTEKDFVRLQGKLSELYYLEVAHSLSDEDRLILDESIKTLF